MELHHSARFCRPLPGLLGQRDMLKERADGCPSARVVCFLAFLNQ